MPAPSDVSSHDAPSTPATPATSAGKWRFLVDENLPLLLVRQLISAGYEAEHVRDVGLASQDDTAVFAYAQTHHLTIITIDKGLSSIMLYPPPHAGIVSVRLPERVPIVERVRLIIAELNDVAGQGIATLANLIIILPGRVRVRHLP